MEDLNDQKLKLASEIITVFDQAMKFTDLRLKGLGVIPKPMIIESIKSFVIQELDKLK